MRAMASAVFLLMTALPGGDLASAATLLPEERASRSSPQRSCTLHNLDISPCPFDHRLEKAHRGR